MFFFLFAFIGWIIVFEWLDFIAISVSYELIWFHKLYLFALWFFFLFLMNISKQNREQRIWIGLLKERSCWANAFYCDLQIRIRLKIALNRIMHMRYSMTNTWIFFDTLVSSFVTCMVSEGIILDLLFTGKNQNQMETKLNRTDWKKKQEISGKQCNIWDSENEHNFTGSLRDL